jgi:heterodisulfide reductase subunit A
VCATTAISLKHFTDEEVLSEIDAAVLEEEIMQQIDAAVGDA